MADDYANTVSDLSAPRGTVNAGGSSTGTIEAAGDLDLFEIFLTAGATYTFDLRGSNGSGGTLADPWLELRDSTGNSLAFNDDNGTNLDSRITFTATASGFYYLEASDNNLVETGTYTLSTAQQDDFADAVSDVSAPKGSVSIGGWSMGTIEAPGDLDLFAVTLEAGTTYTFDLQGRDSSGGSLADPWLTLRDSSGTSLAFDDDSGTGLDSRITFTATTGGTYYLEASDNDLVETGTYSVLATEVGVQPDDFADTVSDITAAKGAVAVGGSSTGRIEAAGDLDLFAVTLTAGANYTFNLQGSNSSGGTLVDPWLELLDSSGTSLAFNDNNGTNLDSRITFTATTGGTYYLEASDNNLVDTGTYTLTVANNTLVNRAPTRVALSTNVVAENSGAGTLVGSLSTTDPDAGDTHTYELVDNAGGRFTLNGSAIVVANASLLNYEAAPSHQIVVRSRDQSGATLDQALTINLADANEPPSNLSLSSLSVAENTPNGAVVGALSAFDPDFGSATRFSIALDEGNWFTLSADGKNLVVANSVLIDYEQHTSHNVTITATDESTGQSILRTFAISVGDVFNENVVGTGGADKIFSGAGTDVLEGGGGDDFVSSGAGDDTIIAGHGGGNDRYNGGFGIDTIRYASTLAGVLVDLEGGKAQGKEIDNDILEEIENVVGGSGGDSLKGNAGSNHISGAAGDDILTGGMGKDTLEGGVGADRFVFSSSKETPRGAMRDVIVGFEKGVDDVDLSLIDANAGQKKNQKFAWVDKGDLDAKFTGDAGELRFKGGVLMGDTNGDKKADFEIQIGAKIGAGDVIL